MKMPKPAIAATTVAAGVAIWAGWGLSATPPASAPRPTSPARPTRATRPFPQLSSLEALQAVATEARRAAAARNRIDRHAAPPRRIQIPAIGVSAPVIALGLNPDHTLETPRVWGETGWYKPGPEPGERGPAVVVGHVDSTTGPAVFYRLREIRRGNVITIRRSDGSSVRFRVQRVEHWPKSDFPTSRVYGHTRGAVLRLVTCSGNFNRSTGHYVDNTIVYASRV
jgi:sortase (surface protein transpeptidase)